MIFKLPFELLLGMRYTRAKRRNGFISFISLSSMLGIALGVMALITIMSIMNGFQSELRDRILGMTAHMTLSEQQDRLGQWQGLYKMTKTIPEVVGAAPNILEQGMLNHGDRVKGVVVRGVLPAYEQEVTDVNSKMVEGHLSDLKAGRYDIILGSELAQSLGVSIGDKVTLVAPQGSISPIELNALRWWVFLPQACMNMIVDWRLLTLKMHKRCLNITVKSPLCSLSLKICSIYEMFARPLLKKHIKPFICVIGHNNTLTFLKPLKWKNA